MRYFTNVNLGIAVDTPKGLLVPTLHNANMKSLNEISSEAKKLAKTCQDGAATPDMLQGGTFTISNLGSFGIESFTPVLNTPQVAILGVNTITTRVKEVNGEIKTYPAMGLSLTYDHRALDGAPASRFLVDLKNALENFSILLSK
jgi:pyruvate dehydrogenase E2 component (dihydrolipoamide acetyltransferase)